MKLYRAQIMAENVADPTIQVMGRCGYVGEYSASRIWSDTKLLRLEDAQVKVITGIWRKKIASVRWKQTDLLNDAPLIMHQMMYIF